MNKAFCCQCVHIIMLYITISIFQNNNSFSSPVVALLWLPPSVYIDHVMGVMWNEVQKPLFLAPFFGPVMCIVFIVRTW